MDIRDIQAVSAVAAMTLFRRHWDGDDDDKDGYRSSAEEASLALRSYRTKAVLPGGLATSVRSLFPAAAMPRKEQPGFLSPFGKSLRDGVRRHLRFPKPRG